MIVKNPHAIQLGGFTNPVTEIRELKDSINDFSAQVADTLDTVIYWINPINWFIELNRLLQYLIHLDETAYFLMAMTIIGICMSMLGSKFHKPYIFWGWIVYWILRGFVYR